MLVNQAALASIGRSFSTIFQQVLQATAAHWPEIASLIPSGGSEIDYKWLGKVPVMKEWLGDKAIANLAAYEYTIKNKDWESTIEVDRNDIEDDQIGLYRPLISSIAQAAKQHPDKLIFDLILAGFTTLCYDGQFFFDTDHLEGASGTQSNKGTAALAAAAYETAYAAMMQVKDDQGEPLNVTPTLLVVPPQLRATALGILEAERLANGETNINRNSAKLLVAPHLASQAAYWFLLDTSKPVKPLIFQQRTAPKLVMQDQPDDENVFMRRKFRYGTESRDNAGYGLWQLAYGSDGTT